MKPLTLVSHLIVAYYLGNGPLFNCIIDTVVGTDNLIRYVRIRTHLELEELWPLFFLPKESHAHVDEIEYLGVYREDEYVYGLTLSYLGSTGLY